MSAESLGLNSDFVRDFAPRQGETIFDKSVPGRRGTMLPGVAVPLTNLPPDRFLRTGLILPEVTEPDIVRHYTEASRDNFGIGSGPYLLGSCTMKYNPERNEAIARLDGFSQVHPDQPEETIQGSLEALYSLQESLARLTGMHATSLTPMGGAQGEFAGILMIRAYHEKNGDNGKKRRVLLPDSAHGTNPATATMGGYEVTEVKSGIDGNVDMNDFREKMGEDVAGFMITQPNTLGLFDRNIFEVSDIIHQSGGLVYGDGANMNALMGKILPSKMGIDVMHINTHKALTTPHGGGGPGAGPVMVVEKLAPYLPGPIVVRNEDGTFSFKMPESSIGRLNSWYGNVAVLNRALSYILTMGEDGLRQVSENAVLNANYVRKLLEGHYPIQYGEGRMNMHEFVMQAAPVGHELGRHPMNDIVKRSIDYGVHPPTFAFPLIADDALMLEPTETESRESLDRIAAVFKAVAEDSRSNPDILRSAPHETPVGRLDEVGLGRKPVLRWQPKTQTTP